MRRTQQILSLVILLCLMAMNVWALDGFMPFNPPQKLPEFQFMDEKGRPQSLNDFKGQFIVLNIWATWCAPCVKEMPSLDRLQGKFGKRIEVIAVSQDFGGATMVKTFYDKVGIKNLAVYTDAANTLPGILKLQGLPVTLLIDKEGYEVGRLSGEAAWDSKEAIALIEGYLNQPQPTKAVKTSYP